MKKTLLTTIFSVFSVFMSFAQYNGEGYYRVRNLALVNIKKENCYAYVTDSYFKVVTQAGTGQSFEPLQLWPGLDDAIASPATVVYSTGTATNIDLIGQGAKLSDMTDGHRLTLSQVGTAYRLSTVAGGATLYLYSTAIKNGGHYIGTTIANSNVAYSYWNILPITADGDNYVGVKPTLSAGGKYYAPYYASYPFKFHSTGMKAYTVTAANGKNFELTEVESEILPASTPLLIECSSENISDNRLELLPPSTTVSTSEIALTKNKLSGVYFCNDFISESYSKTARTEYDPATMRVWNVENGQLVLSSATDLLHKSFYSSEAGHSYLNANQSYLKVNSNASSTLTQGTVGIVDIRYNATDAEPISYTTADGKQSNALQPGLNIVKYSDGTVRKVIR